MRYALALCAAASTLAAADAPSPAQSPSTGAAISPDEQAIYETILAGWLGSDPGRQLVNQKLGPRPSSSDPDFADCAKGLVMASGAAGASQRSLAGVRFSRAGIDLIDGDRWSAQDPGDAMRQGQSVDVAVRNGFSHSLISFSEVAFSADRQDALVNFGIVCGSLCGSGSTMRMHKANGRWTSVKRCGGWIS